MNFFGNNNKQQQQSSLQALGGQSPTMNLGLGSGTWEDMGSVVTRETFEEMKEEIVILRARIDKLEHPPEIEPNEKIKKKDRFDIIDLT